MSHRITRALAVLGVSALIVPAAAVAKPSHAGKGQSERTADAKGKGKGKGKSQSRGKGKGKGKGHNKPRTFVFKGVAVHDGAGDTVVVKVSKGNKAARSFKGEEVTFDLSAAKVIVADTNGDGKATAADVKAGDKVVVQARLPRSTKPGDSETIAARKLVDQTNPPVEEDEQEDEQTVQQPAEQPAA